VATDTARWAIRKTLVAGQQDTITLTDTGSDYLEVTNNDASADLRVTTNGIDVGSADTKDCFIVGPGSTKLVFSGHGADTIKLNSTGAVTYDIVGAK
jgi:hypothetical protein